MSASSVLEKQFLRGETARLAETPLADFEKAGRPELLVGALVLTGALERAEALSASVEPRDLSGLASFHMLVGLARAGKTCEAKERLSHLERLASREDAGPLVSFFAVQGRAFLSFFEGRFEAAVESAREALVEAETSRDVLASFAKILSLDLLAHALVQTGAVRQGLKVLKSARDAAVRLEHQGFSHAIAISVLNYESIYGFDSVRVLPRLMRALSELSPTDSYSRSELRLEISRQLILRGRLQEARAYLEAAAQDILGSENQTQTAAFHFRMAWIAQLEARPADALLALKSSERAMTRNVSSEVAHGSWRRRIESFRAEILSELGREAEARVLKSQLPKPLRETGHHGARGAELQSDFNDDPFSETLARVERRTPGIERELFERHQFALLLPLLGLNFSQTAIVLGAPGGGAMVLNSGSVKVVAKGLTGALGKLLLRLSDGPCSKREAIESIWGHRYESDRHDRLLTLAASRIRKALGGDRNWVFLRGDRIFLRDSVLLRFWGGERGETKLLERTRQLKSPTHSGRNLEGLRIRQLQVLDELATRGDVGVQDLVEMFGISRASALRDLSELVELKLVIRTGETRATRYIRKEA